MLQPAKRYESVGQWIGNMACLLHAPISVWWNTVELIKWECSKSKLMHPYYQTINPAGPVTLYFGTSIAGSTKTSIPASPLPEENRMKTDLEPSQRDQTLTGCEDTCASVDHWMRSDPHSLLDTCGNNRKLMRCITSVGQWIGNMACLLHAPISVWWNTVELIKWECSKSKLMHPYYQTINPAGPVTLYFGTSIAGSTKTSIPASPLPEENRMKTDLEV
ncbi:hypothetical protein T265_11597 [Opisthorchis viverrini]|uniref:Uncharacterized protein n=1 Tax=Opisthorchis viverrini TaxID=6198 RepID=A0A074YY57_OPIVI|nr:hypothetical protein T265_11597 [Opisthorchis viverrini]KER19706.1 hypothetical protein T265_11597 [Opisthorchis viverrini]